MTRARTRQVLSEDAKRAKMEIWAIRAGLDKSAVDKMITLYGSYAYDLMRQAQFPGDLAKKTGYPYASTNKMIKNLLDDEKKMTTEQVAKAVGVSKETVEQNISGRDIPPTTPAQERFDARVDGHTSATPAQPTQGNEGATPPAAPAPSQGSEAPAPTTPDENMGVTPPTHANMTLDDYAANYAPGKGPLTGQALRDAAYNDFGKGEGMSLRLYVEQQNYGHPTIGTGCIVVHRDLCQEPPINQNKHGTVAGWKAEFRKQKLTDENGRLLSNAEKDKIFEDLRTAVRNNTLRTRNEGGYNIIVSPASAAKVRTTPQEVRRIFDERFDAKLKEVQLALGKGNLAKGQEIFNKYPRDLQLALVHTYFAGTPGKTLTKDVRAGRVDPENPMAMVDEIKKLRSSRSEGNRHSMNRASEAEMRTRENARDSLNYAQNRMAEQYIRRQAAPVRTQPEDQKLVFRMANLDLDMGN